jgi:hypothetical protein
MEKAWTKGGRFAGRYSGIPGQAFSFPSTVGKALENGDPIGAAFAAAGWTPGQLKPRQPSEDGGLSYTEDESTLPELPDFEALFNEGLGESAQNGAPEDVDYQQLFNEGLGVDLNEN